MATSQEHHELIEDIKHPIRYYRITLWGYGGESAYMGLTKEQYDYWKAKDEESYDSTLSYMLGCEDGDYDLDSVPDEMDFMSYDEDGEKYYRPWYEAPTEFCHQWGVDYSSARITVEEVESLEYGASAVGETPIDGIELRSLLETIMEEHNYEVDLTEMGVAEGTDEQPDYVLQFYSSEKGTFFEGLFESRGPFDIKRLKVFTEEFPNGEDIVTALSYEDQDIENAGGDTSGKGYSVHFWANV